MMLQGSRWKGTRRRSPKCCERTTRRNLFCEGRARAFLGGMPIHCRFRQISRDLVNDHRLKSLLSAPCLVLYGLLAWAKLKLVVTHRLRSINRGGVVDIVWRHRGMPGDLEMERVSNLPSRSDEELLCVKQAASLLRCGECTVYALCTSGELPHVRIGRLIRLRRSTLLDWIAQSEVRSRLKSANDSIEKPAHQTKTIRTPNLPTPS